MVWRFIVVIVVLQASVNLEPHDVQVNRFIAMETIKTISTTVNYAIINGNNCIMNLADNIIGKRKNADGDIVVSEEKTLVLNTSYIYGVLCESHEGFVAAADNAAFKGGARTTVMSLVLNKAQINIEVSLARAGETYNHTGDILQYDKYNYTIKNIIPCEKARKKLDEAYDKAFGC